MPTSIPTNYIKKHQEAQNTPPSLIHKALKRRFGSSYVRFSYVTDRDSQKAGIDILAIMADGAAVPVELKTLKTDPLSAWGRDELPLELASCVERGTRGFLSQGGKRTKFVLFLFRDSGRSVCVAFRALAAVFRRCSDQWACRFQTATQTTHGFYETYHSRCVFVPVAEIRMEIHRYMRSYAVRG